MIQDEKMTLSDCCNMPQTPVLLSVSQMVDIIENKHPEIHLEIRKKDSFTVIGQAGRTAALILRFDWIHHDYNSFYVLRSFFNSPKKWICLFSLV